MLENCGHKVIRLLPASLRGSLAPTYYNPLDSTFRPSSLFLFLSCLCLIKKHLLAVHCISEQNLYFKHVETWILNLNTNVAGCPYYSISFYLSIITPSRIEHVDRCKWVMKTQGPKNNRRKLNSLILIKSCFGKAELEAEGAAKSSSCLTITPDLLYYVLEKKKKNASFIKFLYSCLHLKLNCFGKFEESSSGVFFREKEPILATNSKY